MFATRPSGAEVSGSTENRGYKSKPRSIGRGEWMTTDTGKIDIECNNERQFAHSYKAQKYLSVLGTPNIEKNTNRTMTYLALFVIVHRCNISIEGILKEMCDCNSVLLPDDGDGCSPTEIKVFIDEQLKPASYYIIDFSLKKSKKEGGEVTMKKMRNYISGIHFHFATTWHYGFKFGKMPCYSHPEGVTVKSVGNGLRDQRTGGMTIPRHNTLGGDEIYRMHPSASPPKHTVAEYQHRLIFTLDVLTKLKPGEINQRYVYMLRRFRKVNVVVLENHWKNGTNLRHGKSAEAGSSLASWSPKKYKFSWKILCTGSWMNSKSMKSTCQSV